ncbi:hypothetical protein OED01_12285 [Microbacterium sp. M28]|uniref:phosphoribosyltransferase-like protein n=1 Tax=Microbacterium sp. M28 TaxID=2962064 RepID=UPI0021F41F94|nr:hypothetical protein [Microbacterium sp. M28]UYO96375.1 hypothetical protein OED01_12285 [Microbacterium sp. M28]
MSSSDSQFADPTDEERLHSRIRTLSQEAWDGRVAGADVNRWLENFDGRAFEIDKERLHALHLLANFDFFNVETVRGMLKSLYRDLYRYPLIQRARESLGGTREFDVLNSHYLDELSGTRFLGMGNPSESGAHLLYYFRQVNGLSKTLFIHQHEILSDAVGVANNSIAIPGLKRLVFVDDLMGSGQQATEYSKKLLSYVRTATASSPDPLEIWYFTLFARPAALDLVRALPFDRVEAVHEIDDAEKAFSAQSRVYRAPPAGVTLDGGRQLATTYGSRLFPSHPLGYLDGQLLLGFEHNVPDNSLPVFWLNETSVPWEPVFPRFHKVN